MIRLGLCCMFRDRPIKFVTTTATAIGRMQRPDALAKLNRLCLENADAKAKEVAVEKLARDLGKTMSRS